ncbi:MAG TPA: hypothetical protein PLW80_07020, partial [Spirochaetales bacterium]|nr:hypothetical protein [Spirochaetales bacterium]
RVRRASYAEADVLLGSGALASLAKAAELRKAYRLRNGAVDIAIPEVRVWVEDGEREYRPCASTHRPPSCAR